MAKRRAPKRSRKFPRGASPRAGESSRADNPTDKAARPNNRKQKSVAAAELARDFAAAVLYEDNHLLAVHKPCGIPTMGAAGRVTLFDLACDYIREKYRKPGKVYLGVVMRLDAFSSGAIILARTSKAASRLSEQLRKHQLQKKYWVLLEGNSLGTLSESGTLRDELNKDDAARKVRVVSNNGAGRVLGDFADNSDGKSVDTGGLPPSDQASGQLAELDYRVLQVTDTATLVEVDLKTGRKHQIRVQFSHRGHAVVGDAKYGGKPLSGDRICLHCRELTLTHPTTKERMTITAAVPRWWPQDSA